jgi:glucosamine-6-phosphate deaminase
MVHVVRYESPQDWAQHVAARFASFLADHPSARVALPTGATPEPIYAGIIEAVRNGLASFDRAHVFLLDEFGGVPKDARGRCEAMLRRSLLDHLPGPPAQYHGFDADAPDVDAMCAEYEAAAAGSLDLVILGIGKNGHVGMNEPGTPPDSTTRRVALAPSTTQASVRYFGEGATLPTWGVTMGIATILAARTIWLIASGEGKAQIVRDVLLEPVSAQRPASLLRGHPNCWFFLDEAAASKLPAGVLSRE